MKCQLEIYKIIKDAGKPLTVSEIKKALNRTDSQSIDRNLLQAVKFGILITTKEKRIINYKIDRVTDGKHLEFTKELKVKVYDLGMDIDI